jgi:hypothetical protein
MPDHDYSDAGRIAAYCMPRMPRMPGMPGKYIGMAACIGIDAGSLPGRRGLLRIGRGVFKRFIGLRLIAFLRFALQFLLFFLFLF